MKEVTIDAKTTIWTRVWAGRVPGYADKVELHARESGSGTLILRVCRLNDPQEIDNIDPHWLAAYALLQKAQE